MTQKILLIGLAACLYLSFTGCAGVKGGLRDDDPLGKLSKKKMKLMKKGILAEVAVAKSKDLQTGINKVELEARSKLTRAMETKTSALQKAFKEEVGEEHLEHFTQVSKSVASTVLMGTVLVEAPYKKKKGVYEVFGLIVMDHKAFKDAIDAQIAANKATKTRWLASKAYQELKKEAAEFEQFKKELNAPPGAAGSLDNASE